MGVCDGTTRGIRAPRGARRLSPGDERPVMARPHRTASWYLHFHVNGRVALGFPREPQESPEGGGAPAPAHRRAVMTNPVRQRVNPVHAELPVVGAGRDEHRRPDGLADRRHADHRPAGHPARPPHGHLQPALDRRRLHPRGDGAGPERGAGGRHGRSRTLVHTRLRHLHGCVRLLRPGTGRNPADRLASRPGRRRRAPDGQRDRAGHRRVPAHRAGQGPRHQRHGCRRGRDHGPDPRRLADRLRLADGVLVQRPDRARRARRGRLDPGGAGNARPARGDRLGRFPPLLRRPHGADDVPGLRRRVRLDDLVGHRRVPGLRRGGADLPLGRGASPRPVAGLVALPGPAVCDGQPDRLPQCDRSQRGPIPAGLLPPGRPGRGPGHGRADAGASGDRPRGALADQRRAGRPLRLTRARDGGHGHHGPGPGGAHDAGRDHPLLAARALAAGCGSGLRDLQLAQHERGHGRRAPEQAGRRRGHADDADAVRLRRVDRARDRAGLGVDGSEGPGGRLLRHADRRERDQPGSFHQRAAPGLPGRRGRERPGGGRLPDARRAPLLRGHRRTDQAGATNGRRDRGPDGRLSWQPSTRGPGGPWSPASGCPSAHPSRPAGSTRPGRPRAPRDPGRLPRSARSR